MQLDGRNVEGYKLLVFFKLYQTGLNGAPYAVCPLS